MKTLEKRFISYFFILLIINYSVSCGYYKEINTPAYEINRLTPPNKIYSRFIIHQQYNIYELSYIKVDQTGISGTVKEINKEDVFYSVERKRKEYKRRERAILNEVHIYLNNDSQTIKLGSTKIQLEQIENIIFIEKDKHKTTIARIIGVFGIFAILTILGAIILYGYSSSTY